MSQKHKATVPDSALCMEMNALEAPLMPRDPQALNHQRCLGPAFLGDICLHDTGFVAAGTLLPGRAPAQFAVVSAVPTTKLSTRHRGLKPRLIIDVPAL
jgi:hypothetical protein